MKRAQDRESARPRYAPARRTPPGEPPGTFVIDPAAPHPDMQLMAYSAEGLRELPDAGIEDIAARAGQAETRWVNVNGLGDADTLRRIAEIFALHPLAQEDVVNLHQRAKIEDYGDYLFIVLRMPFIPEGGSPRASEQLGTEQMSLCLGHDYVLSFQERRGDGFDPVRRRLRSSSGQIRMRGAAYLAYALIDVAIDSYFPQLEALGERLEVLESDVIREPATDHIARIHALKGDLLTIRRAVWPLRDMLGALLRDDTALIDERTHIYLRDCHDHAIQLIDMIETYREIASGLVDIHLSSVSNRMNEVMKVLTIIATIFIPLTFVAGIYGMNFDPEASPWNMPELGWRYGYPLVMGLMLGIAVALVVWFRRVGWIGRARDGR